MMIEIKREYLLTPISNKLLQCTAQLVHVEFGWFVFLGRSVRSIGVRVRVETIVPPVVAMIVSTSMSVGVSGPASASMTVRGMAAGVRIGWTWTLFNG